jgi:hypothetical protein
MTHIRILLSTIACLFVSLSATAADWEGVFSGTLGKSQVLVELTEPLDDMEGETKREASRYSYLPKTRDLNLMLKSKSGDLRFEETLLPHYQYSSPEVIDKKVTGTWVLSVKGASATGEWTSPDGKKRLPIKLSRVPNLPADNPFPNSNIWTATYNAEWLKHVTIAPFGKPQNFGAVGVDMMKDSAFGIEHPMLSNFPDAARKQAANTVLTAAFKTEIAQYRDCKNGVPIDWVDDAQPSEPEFAYTVDYATPNLLSFTIGGSVFCGGAHPANYVTPVTYDLSTAEQIGGRAGENKSDLNPDAFGRILKLANKQERMAFERFALGLWKAGAAKDKDMAETCMTGWIDDSPEGEKDFSLSFTPKGLAITRRDYPHVASVCLATDFNPTIIPWADLKPWLKPDQTLLNTEIQ